MIVKSLWFWRKNEESPELLVAWDEFGVEANFDGWQDACRSALDSVRSDMSDLGYRYIDLRVDSERIEEMFYANEIEATATESS